jgi:ATP-binding cassette subfamily F protein 3
LSPKKHKNLKLNLNSEIVRGDFILRINNFLVFDEPTNHLDIPSIEVLENSLLNYDCTILCVSHDEYFLSKLKINKRYLIKSKILILE